MSSFTRLASAAVVCVGLLAVGSPALADDATAPATTTTVTTADAGIQSAGLASRAPGTGCAKKKAHRAARRACVQGVRGR